MLSLAMNTVEINRADVLFTESYGERRKQAAMEISPGKSRCSIYCIMYTFVKQDIWKFVSSPGLSDKSKSANSAAWLNLCMPEATV